MIVGLDDISIEKLAAGSNHSMALTTEGQVYIKYIICDKCKL